MCQYEQTPDSHFIIDRHPVAENVWIVGGGSGHGFKHGPAVGEMMAELILKDSEAERILAAQPVIRAAFCCEDLALPQVASPPAKPL